LLGENRELCHFERRENRARELTEGKSHA